MSLYLQCSTKVYRRDYWSTSPLLRSDLVVSAIGRRKFEQIKSHIKYHKLVNENANVKIWRVRHIMNIFNDNIKHFSSFCTALSVDEMMQKFHGQISFEQFIKSKAKQFSIKEWAFPS